MFERPVERARAKHRLVAFGHAAGGRENVIVAAAPVELRAFDGVPARQAIAIDDHHALVAHAEVVGPQAMQRKAVLDTGAALRPAVNEIAGAVVRPERARIDEAAAAFHQRRRRPGGPRIRGRGDKQPEIRIGEKNPKTPRVKPDRGRPDPAAVARGGKMRRVREPVVCRVVEPRQRVVHERPVDQIARMQDRQPRHVAETRGRQPEVLADTNRIRIRIIGVKHRVFVGAVALVGEPGRDRGARGGERRRELHGKTAGRRDDAPAWVRARWRAAAGDSGAIPMGRTAVFIGPPPARRCAARADGRPTTPPDTSPRRRRRSRRSCPFSRGSGR